jgi:hypothetical protein
VPDGGGAGLRGRPLVLQAQARASANKHAAHSAPAGRSCLKPIPWRRPGGPFRGLLLLPSGPLVPIPTSPPAVARTRVCACVRARAFVRACQLPKPIDLQPHCINQKPIGWVLGGLSQCLADNNNPCLHDPCSAPLSPTPSTPAQPLQGAAWRCDVPGGARLAEDGLPLLEPHPGAGPRLVSDPPPAAPVPHPAAPIASLATNHPLCPSPPRPSRLKTAPPALSCIAHLCLSSLIVAGRLRAVAGRRSPAK